jgi:uncharacterized protein (DUF4415 family)
MEREVAEIADEDIDLSDIPEWTADDFAKATRNPFYRPVKDQVTLRIDRYVLEWFRQNHPKYQTAINAALVEHIRRERTARNGQNRERSSS